VFRFKLEILDQLQALSAPAIDGIDHDRVIPAAVKIEVWKRDKGSCVKCGSKENLHFDHIIPYSHGGSSKDAKNIQILCLRHNLAKHDRIE
jgi:5-methylcytosine-specific restriction endonuclease McrA